MSNSLYPEQTHLILYQTACKGYQQMTKLASGWKRANKKLCFNWLELQLKVVKSKTK